MATSWLVCCSVHLQALSIRRWNENEFSGVVGECHPSSRCLGGQFSTCAAAYTGAYCSHCITGYYEYNQACYECSGTGTVVGLLFLQVRNVASVVV